jgi:hypothetical protein
METPQAPATIVGQRRNEDIALDLMKFIASVTDIGKAAGVGFQQAAAAKGQENAEKLLDLYGKCLHAVQGRK